ncbi:hypothetical protein [Streptomyces sp. AK02-01A]|uniref:hypothetical protein n=1 Tax=Streptomyces sp. AK02-01A TaxID=3028648 RepID=UPI0029AF1ED3|nr:hypothetical protein [Streptomyces sp. AK02-01A]MDX3851588.1 hypothetical protein [Streptomyces sp. AK02-01A]
MEAELVALATAGATALVQQMATDGWTRARERMVRFFAERGSASPETIESDLETARAELVAAQQDDDETTAADLRAEWRNRLRRTLREDPAAAVELRALLDELTPGLPVQQVHVHNTVSGGIQHAPVIQAGTINGLRLGGPDSGH